MDGTKRCGVCKAEKPRTEFYKQKASKDGLQPRCKLCSRAQLRAWQAKNPERVRELRRTWVKANPEKAAASDRAYKATIVERERVRKRRWVRKWRKANPERSRALNRMYSSANPEKRSARNARRRARKLNAIDHDLDREAVLQIERTARLMSAFLEGAPVHVDHVVPLARGGLHHQANLRPLPARLNTVKGAKLDEEVDDTEFVAWVFGSPRFEQVAIRTQMRSRRATSSCRAYRLAVGFT